MISITGLNKTFLTPSGRVNALKDINLTVDKGDIFGIIGFSGAGKSTLIRCLNRLEEPDSGTIRIGDQEITRLDTGELRAARKKIGMIFQHYYLFESRTVFGNVAFPLEIAGYQKQRIGHRAAEILELVGLSDKLGAYPAQLSGGQKQRVGIARALANEPDVLLSDEATSSLDPSTSRSILDLLRDINQKLGLTIVMITHEMDVLRYLCANAAVIDAGEIIETGSVAELSSHPRQEITRLFFVPSRQGSLEAAQGMRTISEEQGEGKEASDVR
jgi:D-methionine transport system ATP-binding protein